MLISKNKRYPKENELYAAIENFNIRYLTHHFAPFTGGGNVMLRKGDRIIIGRLCNVITNPIIVYAMPTEYELIESRIENDELNKRTYRGYSLYINTKELNKHFKKIDLQQI